MRDNDTHIQKALESVKATTAAHRKHIEQSYGARYSELFNLKYFDVVCSHVVDPMHNLFLGLAKHTIKTWKDLNILRPCDYTTIQDRVNSFVPPTKIGRIPRKIQAGFASFTADEWKNLIIIYSAFSFHKAVPDNHMTCWHFLIDACLLLCQPMLTKEQIVRAHDKIICFCKCFESLYGSEYCTPNMHLACHLRECILDFGPLTSWCFPFERYNGYLESTQKSWNGPEKQIFQKFLDMQFISCLSLQDCDSEDTFLRMIYEHHREISSPMVGSSSLDQTTRQDMIFLEWAQSNHCQVSRLDATEKPISVSSNLCMKNASQMLK